VRLGPFHSRQPVPRRGKSCRCFGAAIGRGESRNASRLVPVSGACPRLELTVSIEKGVEYLRNQHARVHSIIVNVLLVLRVALEAGVQVASQHDSNLHGAKRSADACEFHLNLKTAGFRIALQLIQGRT
jgi:hypothetical protein